MEGTETFRGADGEAATTQRMAPVVANHRKAQSRIQRVTRCTAAFARKENPPPVLSARARAEMSRGNFRPLRHDSRACRQARRASANACADWLSSRILNRKTAG